MKKDSQKKPELTSKFIRLAIIEALLNHPNEISSVSKSELIDEIYKPDGSIAKKFSLNADKSIERTVERTLEDLSSLEQGILNIKVNKVKDSKPSRFYATTINIDESLSKIPNILILSGISSAIKAKKLIKLKYNHSETVVIDGKTSNPISRSSHVVFPLYIALYNDIYYLISYDESESKCPYRHFMIENIQSLDITKYPSKPMPIFNAKEYISQHPYMLEGNPEDISLILKSALKQELSRLLGKHISSTYSGNDNFPLKVEVKATTEGIKKWIFSNLGNCYVSSPKSLCKQIIDEISSANIYITNLMEDR